MGESTDAWWKANREAADRAFHHRDDAEAERLDLEAIQQLEHFGPYDWRLDFLVWRLLYFYARDGFDCTKLQHLAYRWLALWEAAVGSEHVDLVRVLRELAALLEPCEQADEVEQLYRRSLAIGERVYGPEHREVGRSLYWLGWYYRHRRRPADAEPVLRRALTILDRTNQEPTIAGTKEAVEAYHDRGLCEPIRRFLDAVEQPDTDEEIDDEELMAWLQKRHANRSG